MEDGRQDLWHGYQKLDKGVVDTHAFGEATTWSLAWPRRVQVDFGYMKTIVEQAKRFDDQLRPAPMDMGSFAEIRDHADFVQWNASGAPEWAEYEQDWSSECAQGQHSAWNDDETHGMAAFAEANATQHNALEVFIAQTRGD